MDRTWLKAYPPGVPAEIDVREFASLRDVLRSSFERFAPLPAYSNMGATMTYAQVDRSEPRFRRLPAAVARPAQGRPGGDHDAQPAAVRGRAVRRAARRAGGGERQSAVHGARTGAPARGLGRHGDRGARELRPHAAGGAGEEPDAEADRRSRPRSATCSRWSRRWSPTSSSSTSSTWCPQWKIAGATDFNAALRTGHGQALDDVPLGPRRHRLPAVHRRHDRRGQGRRADPRQPGRERAADGGLDRA